MASSSPTGITIQVTNGFAAIEAKGAPVTLTAVISGNGPAGNLGVTWTLSLAGAACSPICGTLQPAAAPSLSAVYTPPSAVPANQGATITVRSIADNQQVFVFNFQIVPPIVVSITPKFSSINVAGMAQNLTATVSSDIGNAGLSWTLTAGGANCSPACGVLTPAAAPALSAQYQPPATPPLMANASPTITATSVADSGKKDSFTFNIVTPPIIVMITNKFTSATTAGQSISVNASLTNDFQNQGVMWSLTAGGAACSPDCGSLTAIGTPSTSATYMPPATPPSGANVSPTITAAAVTDPTNSDSFSFNIVTPPISVTITNKLQIADVASGPITINASLMNDFSNQGVTWTLSNAGAACTATCGTLTAVGSPSTSATYMPPPTATPGSVPSPTITATSVADPTKSDSFTFALIIPSQLISGSYIFLLRGYDQTLMPMAFAGVLVLDGSGNITSGEYDLNDNTTVTTVSSGVSGTYAVDTSFQQIPRVTVTINTAGAPIILKCTFSADGKRGKVIELDSSLALTAGTILQQDPAGVSTLTGASSTRFAFGLDSDAPVNNRVVETGQFILAGATSVTGGVADEGEANVGAVFGGPAGAANVSPASSAVTAPDALGRGTLTLAIAATSTITTQYAYYVVSSSQLDLIETDTGGTLKTVQAGTAMNQSGLTATSSQGNSVIALTGMSTIGGAPSPNVIIGQMFISGGAAQFTYDSNIPGGGAATLQQGISLSGSLYDPNTGRMLLNLQPGGPPFVTDAAVYLYDTNAGFMADVTIPADGTNQGFSGPVFAQTIPTGSFTLQSLSGNMIGVGGATSSPSMANLDFAGNADGNGNFTALFDFTVPNLSVGLNGQGVDGPLSGFTFQIDNPAAGHGLWSQVPSGFFNNFPIKTDQMSFYLVGPNQFVAIEDLGFSPSGIIFFENQQ